MNWDELGVYVDKIYKFFLSMKPGKRITINNLVSKKNQPLFLQILRMYQQETNDYNIQLNAFNTQIFKKK